MSSTSSSIDYLSSLPAELLIKIFKQSGNIFKTGISNSLLPFTRPTLYRQVVIKSPRSFKLFCRTLIEDTLNHIGSEVLLLEVLLNEFQSNSAVRLAINVKEVVTMLKTLVKLKSLVVSSNWFSPIILSKVVAFTSLPQMTSLKIVSPSVFRSDPWNPVHFQHLKHYSKLETLILVTNEVDELPTSVREQKIKQFQPLYTGLELELLKLGESVVVDENGGFSITGTTSPNLSKTVKQLVVRESLKDRDMSSLITRFHNLNNIRLGDSFTSNHILHILEGLPNPSQINQLYLQEYLQPRTIHHYVPFKLYPTISKYTGLTYLTLPPRGFSPDLFNYLRDPLPLVYLSFAKDTPVSIKQLKSLILPGIAKLSSLKTLVLNVVEGKISPDRVEELGPFLNDKFDEEPKPHPGWILPKWIEGEFDENGLKELRRIGKQFNVKIIGTSIKALGIKDAYELEIEEAEEMYESMSAELMEARDAAMQEHFERYGEDFDEEDYYEDA